MTAHRGVENPAAVVGTDKQRQAFRNVLTTLHRRIELFLSLPHEKLASLSSGGFARSGSAESGKSVATPFAIERADADDLEAIRALLEDARLPAEDVGRPGQVFLGARSAGTVVACVGLELYGDAGSPRRRAIAGPARARGRQSPVPRDHRGLPADHDRRGALRALGVPAPRSGAGSCGCARERGVCFALPGHGGPHGTIPEVALAPCQPIVRARTPRGHLRTLLGAIGSGNRRR